MKLDKIISQSEAVKAGEYHFYTGKLCEYCQKTMKRLTQNAVCYHCGKGGYTPPHYSNHNSVSYYLTNTIEDQNEALNLRFNIYQRTRSHLASIETSDDHTYFTTEKAFQTNLAAILQQRYGLTVLMEVSIKTRNEAGNHITYRVDLYLPQLNIFVECKHGFAKSQRAIDVAQAQAQRYTDLTGIKCCVIHPLGLIGSTPQALLDAIENYILQ